MSASNLMTASPQASQGPPTQGRKTLGAVNIDSSVKELLDPFKLASAGAKSFKQPSERSSKRPSGAVAKLTSPSARRPTASSFKLALGHKPYASAQTALPPDPAAKKSTIQTKVGLKSSLMNSTAASTNNMLEQRKQRFQNKNASIHSNILKKDRQPVKKGKKNQGEVGATNSHANTATALASGRRQAPSRIKIDLGNSGVLSVKGRREGATDAGSNHKSLDIKFGIENLNGLDEEHDIAGIDPHEVDDQIHQEE